MKTNCGIYKITNVVNNKVYIGSSQNLKSRKYYHFHSLKDNNHENSYLQNSFNKHGEDNFKWDILKYIEKIKDKQQLKEYLLKLEQEYLNEYIVDNLIDKEKCYNLSPTAGSPLGYKHSEEFKKEQSLRFKDRIFTEEWKLKISLSKQNVSEETREKCRRGRLGTKHSEESIQKIRQSKTGLKQSKETIEKRSKAIKERGTKNNTKVINLDTNKVFDSIRKAAEFYGINTESNNISLVCSGKRKICGGYRWSYVK